MTFHHERTAKMVSAARRTADLDYAERAVINVFEAYSTRAFSVDTLTRIASAVEGIEFSTAMINFACAHLVHHKFLRSRLVRGNPARHYEIAFGEEGK